jgi:DnaJ-class molecular chaperone
MTNAASLRNGSCHCVCCAACGGSGQVEYQTHSYPEWDLETCEDCGGTGITETCESCQIAREVEMDQEDARL